ncbi:MAG: DUF6298 domain-containing protein [Flavobacterium sp.]|nr:DUF6298 domain-containing protein [Flavobacterium sp.]
MNITRCSIIFNTAILPLVFLVMFTSAFAQKAKPVKPLPPVAVINNKLVYTPDSLGNRIPDFSYCGFKTSEQPIPNIAIKVTVPTIKGDATLAIQLAINYVAKLPLDKDGFRGTVLLAKGKFEVFGQLKITASGIVLRGSGIGENGTQIIGASTDRATLIRVFGKNDKQLQEELAVTEKYVPVNANKLSVTNASNLKVGDNIIIRRPSTKEWISDLGTESFGGGLSSIGWKVGELDICFDRTITAINGNEITIDAPLTTALDAKYGGGFTSKYQWDGRIQNIGIENLELVSTYDKTNPKDEAHRWMAITLENVQDAWVRQVNFKHFAGSAVNVLETAKRITVEDCQSLQPISEIGGQRRYTFFTTGQQTLFQRCYAEEGYHDFATGYCAAGPNAFVQCASHLPYNFSGGIDSWASGILFDVAFVDGNAIRLGNRGQDGQGAGWAAANSLLWNCSASRIDCYKPPTAQNWSFGSWAQFAGDGYWTASNDALTPRSFFYTQLKERLNKNVDAQAQILSIPTEASSSPSVEVALQLTKQSIKPKMQLNEWIALASERNNIATATKNIKAITEIAVQKDLVTTNAAPMLVKNGVLVRGNEMLFGKRQEVPWWSGGVQGSDLAKAQLAITRFVPGRTGNGLTDDLEELTETMLQRNIIGIEHHYALWYERRRDDHERIRRMDGEVWAPFYELPFARTGKDVAWDGLSKYDLTKYNTWYWQRLKQFADLADVKGLLLVHQNYFQHNIIEAGAHYADFPWRTANNINNTGFPEPVPYAGDKRVFMAEQFYDISNPVRREIHKKYIRQCLNNFKDNSGVIQLIGEEFTGPLHFVKFWLDVVKDWEKETGKHQIIGLSCTKDVQDSILQNPAYTFIVDLIDIRYWHYQADSIAYAPKGGQNLAPRQHARLLKPKKTSFEQVYKAVKEYRTKYPEKAVLYSSDSYDQFGLAVLLAGGSLPVLPAAIDKNLLNAAAKMKPIDGNKQFALSNGKSFIVYGNGALMLNNIDAQKNYTLQWFDAKFGKAIKQETVTGDKLGSVLLQGNIVWIQ